MTFLIWLAVLPGLFLIFLIYRMDKIEKEPLGLLCILFLLGAVSTLPIAFLESCLDDLVVSLVSPRSVVYLIIENFLIIALFEEVGKFFVLERCSWGNPNFNFLFDGVVYAVCTGMGFAIAENILYVTRYGFETAIIRMLTALPAHLIFAIFMGHYYGLSKKAEIIGDRKTYSYARKMALIVPVLIHGVCDVMASIDALWADLVFVAAVIVLDVVAFIKVRGYSKKDEPVA